MDEKFLLVAAVGIGFFFWQKQSSQQPVNERFFNIPGVGPVAESQLPQYGYQYFPPAGGFVHQTVIQSFLQAGGTSGSTYPGEGGTQGGIPWDALFDGAIELIGVFTSNNNNSPFEDTNNPGAGTYNDGVWSRSR